MDLWGLDFSLWPFPLTSKLYELVLSLQDLLKSKLVIITGYLNMLIFILANIDDSYNSQYWFQLVVPPENGPPPCPRSSYISWIVISNLEIISILWRSTNKGSIETIVLLVRSYRIHNLFPGDSNNLLDWSWRIRSSLKMTLYHLFVVQSGCKI